MGVSIWIVPSLDAAANLKTLMRLPLGLNPLPYHAPTFDPHITLVSFPSTVPTSVLRSAIGAALAFSHGNPEICTGAAAGIPLRVKYGALATGDHFFRSVLLDISPSAALVAFRARVLEALEALIPDAAHTALSPRFPHLSLFYIPDEHAEYRERVRDALYEKYAVRQQRGGGDNGIAFDLPSNAGAAGFEASEVWIVRCDDLVEEWEVLDRVSIISPCAQ